MVGELVVIVVIVVVEVGVEVVIVVNVKVVKVLELLKKIETVVDEELDDSVFELTPS